MSGSSRNHSACRRSILFRFSGSIFVLLGGSADQLADADADIEQCLQDQRRCFGVVIHPLMVPSRRLFHKMAQRAVSLPGAAASAATPTASAAREAAAGPA